MSEQTKPRKKTGPKPKLITLHPFTFDEVVDTLLYSKPKEKHNEVSEESGEEEDTKEK